MTDLQDILKESGVSAGDLVQTMKQEVARRALLDFTLYTKKDYQVNWHHKYGAGILDRFQKGEIKNLMFFQPPQTGKTEIATRRLASKILGDDPDHHLALAAYSATKAEEYSSDIQRIMDSKEYVELYPGTRLAESVIEGSYSKSGKRKRRVEHFEILDTAEKKNKGFMKAVGVEGPLTGTAVDTLIIDDPHKDHAEAESSTIREKIWKWYESVAETRLHNDSQQLLCMTRWHEDDLAGRLLEAEDILRKEGTLDKKDEWVVIILPALKEDNKNPDDPREIGEALWPERHSAKRYRDKRKKSPRIFASLYQQRPRPKEGTIFNAEWFPIKQKAPDNLTWDMWIDGAFTKKTTNDPTGIFICAYRKPYLYIVYSTSVYMRITGLLDRIPILAKTYGMTNRSRIRIEPKASGHDLQDLLKEKGYNAVLIRGKHINDGKEARGEAAAPSCEAGRVILIDGNWTSVFLDQVAGFPHLKHDEDADNLGYAVHHYMTKGRRRGTKHRR